MTQPTFTQEQAEMINQSINNARAEGRREGIRASEESVVALNSRLSEAVLNIADLNSQISHLQKNINELKASNENLTDQVIELQSREQAECKDEKTQ